MTSQAMFDVEQPKRLRSLEDTEDGIDEAGWESKVRELPAWDRCDGDGGRGGVDALDLSDPAKAPFGREWRLGLVEDDEEDPTTAEGAGRFIARKNLESYDQPAARRPPVFSGDEQGTDPTAADKHQGAADHQGPAAPAPPGRVSSVDASLVALGFMDPREAIARAAVEEHAERWHGDEIEPGPMRLRTKTKADHRVEANVQRFRRPLEVTS